MLPFGGRPPSGNNPVVGPGAPPADYRVDLLDSTTGHICGRFGISRNPIVSVAGYSVGGNRKWEHMETRDSPYAQWLARVSGGRARLYSLVGPRFLPVQTRQSGAVPKHTSGGERAIFSCHHPLGGSQTRPLPAYKMCDKAPLTDHPADLRCL